MHFASENVTCNVFVQTPSSFQGDFDGKSGEEEGRLSKLTLIRGGGGGRDLEIFPPLICHHCSIRYIPLSSSLAMFEVVFAPAHGGKSLVPNGVLMQRFFHVPRTAAISAPPPPRRTDRHLHLQST